jgi:hypothetical protein
VLCSSTETATLYFTNAFSRQDFPAILDGLIRYTHNLPVDSVRGRCEHILSMWRKEDVIQKLKDSQADRSLRSYADTLGCSPSYLCDLYSGKREPGEKILKQLGLEKKVTKTVTYVKRRWR